jgi:hypothetical protein
MFALIFCYEGVDDCMPYATTIAVSENRDILVQKMKECVEEDMEEPNSENGLDVWNDTCNWRVCEDCYYKITLQHKMRTNLYASYKIQSVEVL